MAKTNIPKEKGLDHTIELLKEGYEFVMNRNKKFESDIFETHILGEKAIVLTGSEFAELFYDNAKFRRKDATPMRFKKTLFGVGGVQGLDGDAHEKRKAMFMKLMTKDAMKELETLTKKYWREYFESHSDEPIELYEASKIVLLQVACDWVGVPLEGENLEKRAQQIADLFESAGEVGIEHYEGRHSRTEAEKWLKPLIDDVRSGKVDADKDRALYQFSHATDIEGELLDENIVAVELLNLIRPINAISVWIAVAARALHDFPEEAEKLKGAESIQIEWFIQEVRRYYPFFPVAPARVDEDFEYRDYEFKEGTLTLLDLYGTNRHEDDWIEPNRFMPERFEGWQETPFNFIPQGGGSYDFGHRCAGEFVTIAVLRETVDFLVNDMTFDFPEQDFEYPMNKIPGVPNSNAKITNIHLK